MKKTSLIVTGIVVILVAGLFFIFFNTGSSVTGNVIGTASAKEATMYKSPNCGCCVGHGKYLDGKGYDVEIVANDAALAKVKGEQNIPSSMRSCHTTFIDGYFIEGHIPIEAINKLLSEKPEIDGIALPDMPAGSPGMPGYKQGDWIIYAIKDGYVSEFMRI
jgi:hypothetical protein